MFDLHIHSIYSDGSLSPKDIVLNIKQKNLKGFSLTDHDTIDGLEEAKNYSQINNLFFIPGIEFGINFMEQEVHILGYFIDEKNTELIKLTDSLKDSRVKRIERILNKLNELKIPITMDELEKYKKTKFTSRTHIAMYLKENGYTNNMKESFDKYLGEKGLAYEKKDNISIDKVVSVIKNSGGVVVLAHPFHLNDRTLKSILGCGIDGIEVINSKHNRNDIIKFIKLSEKYHLISTSGSDCHGRYFSDRLLMGDYLCPKESIDRLKALHELRCQ